MKNRLLVTSAIAGLALIAASPAFADCVYGGGTWTCTGADVVGVQDSGEARTVTVATGATVEPAAPGDDAILIGSGNITVDTGGAVTSTGAQGIHTDNGAGGATVSLLGTASVSGGDYGMYFEGQGFVTLSSTSTVSGGTAAIRFLTGDNSLDFNAGATVNGNILATGGANDYFNYFDSNSTFDTSLIGTQFQGFEAYTKQSAGTTTLINTGAADWEIYAGTLSLTDTGSIGNAYVANGATLLFDDVDGIYADDVTGTGTWNIINGSVLTLSGDNNGFTGLLDIDGSNNVTIADAGALTGGDIRVNFSTLTFGSGMTAANDFIIGAADATFDTGTNNVILNGTISGAGGAMLGKDGSGTLTLGGTNTFDGGMNINQGRVVATNAGALGTGTVTVTSELEFDGFSGTVANNIAGTGDWLINGTAAAITLTGNNAGFTGDMIVDGVDLTVGSAAALGGGDISLNEAGIIFGGAFTAANNIDIGVDQATLNTQANDVTLSGNITGGAGHDLYKSGSGNLTLTGTNSFGNMELLGGSVTGSGAALGSSVSSFSGAGTIYITGGVIESSINGTLGIVIDNATVTLDNANSFTGLLDIGDNSSVTVTGEDNLGDGDISIDQSALILAAGTYANEITIGANGATFSAGAGDVILSGNIVGATGRFIKGGAGNIILTGTNTFGDGLTINAGRITADSVTALGSGAITNDGELVIDLAAGTETLTNLMSGAGSFEKRGLASTLVVNGNHVMTGDVYATAGTLRVNGSLGSAANTYIMNGATLTGTGTVSNVDVASGGIFSPGNSIGITYVNGDLTFNAGSHYAVEYTATPDDSDKIIATGNIVIANGAILDLTGANGNYFADTNYTILSGASVTGLFTTVNNNRAFLDVDFDDSTATDLIMTLTRNNTSFADILDKDEKDFADAFDDLANDLTTAFTNLTVEQAQAAANTLSNEHQGSAVAFASSVNANILNGIAARMGHAFNGTMEEIASAKGMETGTYVAAYLEPAAGGSLNQHMNFWLQAIGSIGRSDSTASDPTSDRHSYGALGGVDIPFDDKGIYGFFAGYERGEVETDAQGASSDLDNYHVGAYATRPLGNGFTVNGGVAFTWHAIDTVRHVVMPGFESSPESDTDGYSASGFVEISKPMQARGFKYAPFASAGIAHTTINGYAEENGGLANLVVHDSHDTNPFTVLGMRFAAEQQIGGSIFDVFASLGWQHVYGSVDSETTMRFETGTATFRSGIGPRARDSALLSLGFSTQLMAGMNAFAGYNGNWSGYAKDHGFEAGLKWEF